MKQLYTKKNFIAIPVCNRFIVCNVNKTFRTGHIYASNFKLAKVIIALSIEKELPKNPHLAKNMITIATDKEFIQKLKHMQENILTYKEIEKIMKEKSMIDVERCI